MRINTNVSALNTLRNLANSDQAVASATAKLSSGFRINKAMDDAAGLAIANKLRNTGRALGAAQKNVEQGIAMLQIADGSLQSIAGILDRMKELATQHESANTGADAQANIEAEFGVLQTEINRIVGAAQYEGSTVFASLDFRVDDTGDDTNDLVTVPPMAWHQFRASKGEPLGFLCMVNAQRDKPQLPTGDDVARLRRNPAIAAFFDDKS